MEENQIIGTIISSVLHYDDFLEVNGYVRTTDTSKVNKPNQLNPEDKKANEFQDDAIEKHTHVLNLYRHGYAWGNAPDGVSTNEYKQHDNSLKKMSTFENENAASETRPKNVTVYFYLKIN